MTADAVGVLLMFPQQSHLHSEAFSSLALGVYMAQAWDKWEAPDDK